MNLTMNGIFDELRPHIPGALVSPEVIAAMRELNGKLPAALSTTGGFECYLGTRDALADWQLCLFGDGIGREIAAGALPNADIEGSLFADPAWRQVRIFAQHWADPSSPLHGKIDCVWLEFDCADAKGNVPAPGIFFSTYDMPGESSCGGKCNNQGERYAWVIQALELLQGSPLRKEMSHRLSSCFEALPADAQVQYAAIMLSRGRDAARIVVMLDPNMLPEYLARIEFPGSIPAVMEVTADMAQFAWGRCLIDISDTVLPDIGVECFVAGVDRDKKNCLHNALLDRLVDRGLCVPEKRDAFLSWQGRAPARLPNELFPCYIFRNISHVKIVCRGNGSLEAKGYLNFSRVFTDDIVKDLESQKSAARL